MTTNKSCCFLFFDYIDFDVYLNARIFYRMAGFKLVPKKKIRDSDLLIFFRGLPDRIYSDYKGIIHFYDYVCEHEVDVRKFFPMASEIIVISIHPNKNPSPNYRYIHGYLPVIPSLWQIDIPLLFKTTVPLHISNYKPLSNDRYQNQLISMIKEQKIRVFGSKWDRVNITARPLSYLEANLKLKSAYKCYGLMYPYQRGRSLSGRMWQGPILGCIVISEENTNIFSCPGVVELSNFNLDLPHKSMSGTEIASKSTVFWNMQTARLATDLSLSLRQDNLSLEILYCRLLLLYQHGEFLWKFILKPRLNNLGFRAKQILRKTKDG
jgi:hypothetical protein